MDERKIITVNKMRIYSDGFDFRAPGQGDNFLRSIKMFAIYNTHLQLRLYAISFVDIEVCNFIKFPDMAMGSF